MNTNNNTINKYQFGKIIVNDITYREDIIIFPDYVQDKWWREKGHNLQISDLDSVINYKPEVLFIGTGMYGLMQVDDLVIKKLKDSGINKIFVDKTRKVCEEYNLEKANQKIAALHLTC